MRDVRSRSTFDAAPAQGAGALCCVALLAALGCASPDPPDRGGAPADPDVLPAIARIQAHAGPEFFVRRHGRRGWMARNRALGVDTEFRADGVHFDPLRPQAQPVTLRVARFGCVDETASAPNVMPTVHGSRVEYARPGWTEWYANGPLGLEQGFTVREPPACARSGSAELSFEIEIDGADVAQTGPGDALSLRSSAGGPPLHVTNLAAWDATGRPLLAHLRGRGSAATIDVAAERAIYPLIVDPLIWIEQQRLLADDERSESRFGSAVALLGDVALIGASGDVEQAFGAGAAYVFVRTGVTWAQQGKLLVSGGGPADALGSAVALADETAVIAAPAADDRGANNGSAYVYVRTGTTWGFQQRLNGDSGVNHRFGAAVAAEADTAVVGAPGDDASGIPLFGTPYVFTRAGTTWSEVQKLAPGDASTVDRCGVSLAISGDTVVVGCGDDSVGSGSGAAYAFVRTGTTWVEQQRLVAGDAAANDRYGASVSVSGETAVVGAPADADAGAAYVFARMGTTWSEQQKLVASDSAPGDGFGTSVSVFGDTAAVGATVEFGTGAAYVFERSGTQWTEERKLTPVDVDAADAFGVAVSGSGQTVLVGAPEADVVGGDSGAAHVFTLKLDLGDPCSGPHDCASLVCSDGVCCDAACDGECDTCLAVEGAPADGRCTVRAEGDAAQPACPSPYQCNGVDAVCPPDCVDHASCIATHYCESDSSTCELIRVAGDACDPEGATRECETGFCADGVCCDAACDGPCEACIQANTGSPDGACVPIPAGEDPDRDCNERTPSTCAQDGTCDGAGACRLWPAGTECAMGSCIDDTSVDQVDTCDGLGTCVDNGPADCESGYACVGAECQSTCDRDADCAPGFHCAADGVCAADVAGGQACVGDGQCASGLCVDSACCDDLVTGCAPPPSGECGDAGECEPSGADGGDGGDGGDGSGDDGCGCRVAGTSDPERRRGLLALVAFALVGLRRRRGRRGVVALR